MKYFYLLLLALTPSLSNAYSLLGSKWGSPTLGTGATVTYSFMSGGQHCYEPTTTCTNLDSFMPTGYESEIERALDAWASVADLTFIERSDDGADAGAPTSSGDIRFAGHIIPDTDDGGNVLAHAYSPGRASISGDVHFDQTDNWTIDTSGISIFWVALHEIGHSLGLGHSTDDTIMGELYNPSLMALTPDDIAGIQYLYGIAAVPAPEAVWLFSSAMFGFFASRRQLTKATQS